MSDFTYNMPFSNEQFMKGIKHEVKRQGVTELYYLIKNAKLAIDDLGTSFYVDGQGRWDAMGINIKLSVNPNYLDRLDDGGYKHVLAPICSNFIPGEVGYDLKNIIFVADLTAEFNDEDDIIADLDEQVRSTSNRILKEILPIDVINKGQEMSEAYTYLYSVENSIRLFIEIVSKENHGDDYINQITITSSLKRTIQNRKEKAEQNKWLSVRGDSDLFYLDFKDLGSLINSNWDLFKPYFVSHDFILPKLNEMAECRNLIAHNSYISRTERDLIKSYYNSIIMQVSDKFTDDDWI